MKQGDTQTRALEEGTGRGSGMNRKKEYMRQGTGRGYRGYRYQGLRDRRLRGAKRKE